MAINGCKWLELLKITSNGYILLEMADNWLNWQKMMGNGWKGLADDNDDDDDDNDDDVEDDDDDDYDKADYNDDDKDEDHDVNVDDDDKSNGIDLWHFWLSLVKILCEVTKNQS